mmetsp:Transcript_4617/g.10362  ORF Transcript_4617/g.10362 Transcript_4617/m.10362 type:complete len:343 (-) Transcript_4617:360-1388(-)
MIISSFERGACLTTHQQMGFETCAEELSVNGYALLRLDELCQHQQHDVIPRAFDLAREELDWTAAEKTVPPSIDPAEDSSGWTGYHSATTRHYHYGRYNQNREGFVWSNGEQFDADIDDPRRRSFNEATHDLFHVLHNIGKNVMEAIEQRLIIQHGYFQQEFGPTCSSSQWHLKRYVDEGDGSIMVEGGFVDDENVLLPIHTDPSLVSVVVIDREGVQDGGMGLEVYEASSKSWREITCSGHKVAIVFVGHYLSFIAKNTGLFPASKHRVVKWRTSGGSRCRQQRMAATLFVRPRPNAIMKPLPSPLNIVAGAVSGKTPPTFAALNARVARNYMKSKKRSKG